jgi:hypothetical protein
LSLASAPSLVYKRNYLVRGDEFDREDETIDFDVITELLFPLPTVVTGGRPRRS